MTPWTPTTALLFCVGAALMLTVPRLHRQRSERGRAKLRAAYEGSSFIWLRNLVALFPLWATGSVLFGCVVLLPRWLAQWLLLVPMDVIAAGFFLSYRVPAPFLPGWLREEIRTGITRVARPDRVDWVLFWMIVPVIVVSNIGFPFLILRSAGT